MRSRGLGSGSQRAVPASLPRAASLRSAIPEPDTALPSRRPPAARLMALIERVLLGAGIILFVVLVRRMGPAAVWANLRMIGWGFGLVLAQEGVSYIANSTGWRYAFPPPRPAIRFRDLVAARLAGEAINNLTPTATIGGEVVRGRMLEGVVDSSTAWASIAIAKLMQTFAQMGFVFLGLMVVVRQTSLPESFERGLLIGLVVLTSALLTGIIMQRRGMFMAGSRIAGRIGLRVPEALLAQLARLDTEIARFYAAPGAFALSVLGFFVGWCMGVVEVYIVLYCLEIGATLSRAMTIEVLSVAIDALLFFVPAKAGTQEGGKVLIFEVLGLDPAKGLALGIVRRLRELSWSMVGLIVLARHHARQRAARR
jgi:glycosyltransferase 2 family protein